MWLQMSLMPQRNIEFVNPNWCLAKQWQELCNSSKNLERCIFSSFPLNLVPRVWGIVPIGPSFLCQPIGAFPQIWWSIKIQISGIHLGNVFLSSWKGHPKFSPKNLENTWFKTTWYTGLPVRHSLQNTIVVCTNERACSLNSVIAALSNMCCHWSNLKQFGLAFNNVLRREFVVSLNRIPQKHIQKVVDI